MMKKPVIGITCNYDFHDAIGTMTNLGGPGQDWDYLAMDYANAIVRAGGVPVILPNTEKPEVLDDFVRTLDGVICSGGSDVDPHLYGEEPGGFCGPVFVRRDRQEMQIIRTAYAAKLPLLGICRGLQAMNVCFGGTLIQDLPHETGTYHSIVVYSRNTGVHDVHLEKDSQLAKIYGKRTVKVNSLHHQGIRKLAENATVIGKTADGVIEAMSFSGGNAFCLGVQWHPEMMYDSRDQQKLFTAFIRACAKK